MTNFLEVSGGTIAYDDEGTGPLVLCIPGMVGLRQEYRFLTPLLVAAGMRVVTTDIRGMGESSAAWPAYGSAPSGPDVIALLRHLDGGPAVVIGCSSGAATAVWVAAEAPELVSGVALLGPFVRDGRPNLMVKIAHAIVAVPGLARPFWNAFFPTMYPGVKPADFAAYRKRLDANLREPGRAKAAEAYIRKMSHAESEARIPRVTAPALVVMGTADRDFPDPVAEARWVSEALHGELVLIDGAGHHPQAQYPQRVADEVIAFQAAHRA